MTLPFDLILSTIRSAYEDNNEENNEDNIKFKDQDILRMLWAFGTDLKDLYDGILSRNIEIPSEILHILQRLENEQDDKVVDYLNNNGFTLYDIVNIFD